MSEKNSVDRAVLEDLKSFGDGSDQILQELTAWRKSKWL